jgi:hypothetical protein
MSTPPLFPSLPGQGWSVHKKPTFSTIVAPHVSGREVRAENWRYPLWEFEATFDGLGSDSVSHPGLGAQSLQSLMGLFLQCQGQFAPFLYIDPSDNSVVDQAVATGDGATLIFTMPRTFGGFVEPVGWVTTLVNVKVNSALLGSGVSLSPPNALVFTTAPAVAATITASFSYAFLCRFLDDALDFENFMQSLWSAKSVKFRSVRSV